MKITRQEDGTRFEFDLVRYEHGSWGIDLVSVDSTPAAHVGTGRYPNQRHAKRAARASIDRWYHNVEFGWCQSGVINPCTVETS